MAAAAPMMMLSRRLNYSQFAQRDLDEVAELLHADREEGRIVMEYFLAY
jgi:plasmid stabilization system protein ParE